jgi:hypothetical protein
MRRGRASRTRLAHGRQVVFVAPAVNNLIFGPTPCARVVTHKQIEILSCKGSDFALIGRRFKQCGGGERLRDV